jgi:hypothetical protein
MLMLPDTSPPWLPPALPQAAPKDDNARTDIMVNSLERAILTNTYAPFAPTRLTHHECKIPDRKYGITSLDYRGEMIGQDDSRVVSVM